MIDAAKLLLVHQESVHLLSIVIRELKEMVFLIDFLVLFLVCQLHLLETHQVFFSECQCLYFFVRTQNQGIVKICLSYQNQPGRLVLRNETQRDFEYHEWLMLGFELIKTNPHSIATLGISSLVKLFVVIIDSTCQIRLCFFLNYWFSQRIGGVQEIKNWYGLQLSFKIIA